MHPGTKIRGRRRAKGEATWANKMPEMLLAGDREPRKKVVLNAARGIIISKEGRSGGWSDVLRLSQGDREFRKRGLIPLPGHLEHKVRSPASLKEGVRRSRLRGMCSALRGPGQRDTDLRNGSQFGYLRMLKELRTNPQVGTDSHKAWPKAEPSCTTPQRSSVG